MNYSEGSGAMCDTLGLCRAEVRLTSGKTRINRTDKKQNVRARKLSLCSAGHNTGLVSHQYNQGPQKDEHCQVCMVKTKQLEILH